MISRWRAGDIFPFGEYEGVPSGRLKKAFRKGRRKFIRQIFPESFFKWRNAQHFHPHTAPSGQYVSPRRGARYHQATGRHHIPAGNLSFPNRFHSASSRTNRTPIACAFAILAPYEPLLHRSLPFAPTTTYCDGPWNGRLDRPPGLFDFLSRPLPVQHRAKVPAGQHKDAGSFRGVTPSAYSSAGISTGLFGPPGDKAPLLPLQLVPPLEPADIPQGRQPVVKLPASFRIA